MDFIVREIPSLDWLTLIIMGCLALLLTTKLMNPIRFNHFVMLISTNQFITLNPKANKISTPFNLTLLGFQIISVSLFLYLCWNAFEVPNQFSNSKLYFVIMGFYGVLLIFKIIIEKIVGIIFALDTVIEEYLFYKISYRNFLGLLVLPINILFIYAFQPHKIVIAGLCILFLLLNIIVLFSIYRKKETLVLSNIFYFILYLCALEITPYFILYKLIK